MPLRLIATAAVFLFAAAATAAITTTGDTVIEGAFARVGVQGYGSLAVTSPDTLSTGSVVVGLQPSGFGDVLIDAGTIEFDNATIGADGYGSVRVVNGGRFRTSGNSDGHAIGTRGVGRVEATGAGSLLDFVGPFQRFSTLTVAGHQSSNRDLFTRGEISVTDGAELRTSTTQLGFDGSASVVVSGAGSRWLSQGAVLAEVAEITIADGARLIGATESQQSGLTISAGTLVVDGEGSSLSGFPSLQIGGQGDGLARISGGADVTTGSLSVGSPDGPSYSHNYTTATLSLDGAGTTLFAQEMSLGGPQQRAELRLSGGAVLNSDDSFQTVVLASEDDSEVLVEIDGRQTRWNSGVSDLYVGERGRAEFRLAGGAVHNSKLAWIGSDDRRGSGVVEIDGAGSLWWISETLQIQNGELRVSNGGELDVDRGSINIYAGAKLHLDGGVIRSGEVRQDVFSSGLITGSGRIERQVNNVAQGLDTGVVRVAAGERLEMIALGSSSLVEVSGGELVIDFELYNEGQIVLENGVLRVLSGFGADFRQEGTLRLAGQENLIDSSINLPEADTSIIADAGSTNTFTGRVTAAGGAVTVETGAEVIFQHEYRGQAMQGGGRVVFEGATFLSAEQDAVAAEFEADVVFANSATWIVEPEAPGSATLTTTGSLHADGLLSLLGVPAHEEDVVGLQELTLVSADTVTGEFDITLADGDHLGERSVFYGIEYRADEIAIV